MLPRKALPEPSSSSWVCGVGSVPTPPIFTQLDPGVLRAQEYNFQDYNCSSGWYLNLGEA